MSASHTANKQGRVVSMRELVQNTSKVMNELISDTETACVTRYGSPVALIVPLNTSQVESSLIAAALGSTEDHGVAGLGINEAKDSGIAAVDTGVSLNEIAYEIGQLPRED